MKLGLDIDGTICANPAFYTFLAQAWVANGGEVHIISARTEADRGITARQLMEWGFGSLPVYVHLYPEHYDFRCTEQMAQHQPKHAAWKAQVCQDLGIDVLIDDDPRNLVSAREVGVYSLSAGFVEAMKGGAA